MKVGPLQAFGALALLSAACDKREVKISRVATTDETYTVTSPWTTFGQGMDQGAKAKVDVLFMIDDSETMAPLQAKLLAGFPGFMKILQSIPGGPPDLHIGVVSSDLGAGTTDVGVRCHPGGDQGKLQSAPRGPCMQSGLADAWISLRVGASPGGALVTNYGAQDVENVFACIAPLGQAGCGFVHPFGSVLRALGVDGDGLPPAENVGFLRDDAYLAVVFLTNEDDCSAPGDSTLFDSASQRLGDPLGPLTSFRCNAFGHRCRLGGHDGPPSMTTPAAYDECHSEESGPLVKVSDFVTRLQRLKGDPARVFFAAIAGPPQPYVVADDLTPSNGDPAGAWPEIEPSCAQPDGTYADPGVRLSDAAQAFGNRGDFETLCNDSLAPALASIATILVQPLQPSCISLPPDGPGCTVVDRWVDGTGTKQAARVKSCVETQNAVPCWHLDDDEALCGPMRKHLVVERGGADVPAHLFTAVECSTIIP